MREKTVSVIIPTRNAEKYIEKLLNNLECQTIKAIEVIVIDTASTDDTKLICENYNFVNFIQINNGEFDHGGTRNKAARYAKGEILIFMTQDAMPKNNNFIEELIKPLNNDVVATYGRQLPRKNASHIEIFARKFNYSDNNIIKSKDDIDKLGVKTFFLSNVCSSFEKESFWRVGGFPERTIMNEDMIISSKLIFNDKKVCYSSKAEVIHSHDYTYMQQFKRNFDVGVVFTDSSHYFKGVKSESEGVKYVKSAVSYLVKEKKVYLIPHLIIDSGFRFMGYKLGKNYKKIPLKLVKRMSMHSFYFEQYKSSEVI